MGTNPRTPAKKSTRAKRSRTSTGRSARTSQGAASTAGTARSARSNRDKMPGVGEEMWALTYDMKDEPWDKTTGFVKKKVPRPVLDEAADPLDASSAIIKVQYTGFCGSDAGIWFRSSFKDMIHSSLKEEGKTTRVIGHEVFGVVEEVGSVSEARYGIEKGQLVSAESHIVCGMCHQCLIGQTHVCVNEKIIGISQDGGFAEYIKLPARVLWRTDPRKIRREVAAIQEPFGNAVHASTTVDLRGKTVAVFGCGAIGQFVILIARALGASKIIGIEPHPKHAAMALELGADEVIEFTPDTKSRDNWRSNKDVVEKVVQFSNSDGVDVAMEMAGYNSSVNNAFQSVRRGGEVVLFGIRSGDFKLEDFQRIIVKGVTSRSVIGRKMFETWEITKNLLETKENKIQDRIWNQMLNKGKNSIVNIKDFNPKKFEKMIVEHPKVLIKWS
jgi:threonine 3-dehydrogenase